MVDTLSFVRRARRFLANNDAAAASEMAVMAPIALGFLSLAVAGGQSLSLYHKTVLTAHTVTDLVSRTIYQPDTVTNTASAELLPLSVLTQDMALSQLVVYPSDTTNLQVVVSELKVNPTSNKGLVEWSQGYNGGTPLATGTYVSLDPSYGASGAKYLVYGQVNYSFQPLGGVLALPQITLSATDFLTIRNAQSITIDPNS